MPAESAKRRKPSHVRLLGVAWCVALLALGRQPVQAAATADSPPLQDPIEVGRLLTANLLARDYMHYGVEGLHYAEAAAAASA